MYSAKRTAFASVAMLAAFLWTDSVIAEEKTASPSIPGVGAPTLAASDSISLLPTKSAPADIRSNPFGSKPLASVALAARRGGDRVFNDNQLKGVVADNRASNLTTGMNLISDGAFAGSAGMSTVIQNSGNNVLIQNATIVNIQLK